MIDETPRTRWQGLSKPILVPVDDDPAILDLDAIVRRAAVSIRLAPLTAENDGLVYYANGQLAFDSNGHRAFAHFLSRAQDDVLLLADTLRLYKETLQWIADDRHLDDCPRKDITNIEDDLACACHQIMAEDCLAP